MFRGVGYVTVCAPPYTVEHGLKSIGTHSKRFAKRFTKFTQSQMSLLVGFVFPFHPFSVPSICSILSTTTEQVGKVTKDAVQSHEHHAHDDGPLPHFLTPVQL